jgi:hypothetical protein
LRPCTLKRMDCKQLNPYIIWQAKTSFFLRLSSAYSCSICSCTHTRHNPTHTHHTHATRTTTTHRSEDRVLREITGTILDSVDDGHLALPLWHHAREAAEIIKGAQPLVRNPHWARLERGRWALHPAARPPTYELVRKPKHLVGEIEQGWFTN